tara:strand:+ start:501 stop:1220 length:720 start_codon:yes stop_codon:yes gene_type:complete
MLDNLKRIYSPNFDIRKRKPKSIEFIILHYTGMKKERDALERLTNQNSKVSCHYFITYSGEIINLVPDLYTSWHAGRSAWKEKKSLNSKSLGIEISNSGHTFKYENFKKKQIESLFFLVSKLKKKYKISNKHILGHSDIAPDRKKDPGEKFPWKLMKKKNMSVWHDLNEAKLKSLRNQKCNKSELLKFFNNLKKIGYQAKSKIKAAKAFQRRFRQVQISGKIDKECFLISNSLIKLNKY